MYFATDRAFSPTVFPAAKIHSFGKKERIFTKNEALECRFWKHRQHRNNFSGFAPRGGTAGRSHGTAAGGGASGGTNGANGANGGLNDGTNDGAEGCGAPTTTPRAMEGPGRSDGGVVGGPARKRQASGAAPPVSKGSGDRHDEGPVPRNNCRKELQRSSRQSPNGLDARAPWRPHRGRTWHRPLRGQTWHRPRQRASFALKNQVRGSEGP